MPSLDVQHRYARLRSYRVGLRREIERLAHLSAWGSGDAVELRQVREARERQLQASEAEWLQLGHLLGKPAPRPPVKLGLR
jgi:hypothetical protein